MPPASASTSGRLLSNGTRPNQLNLLVGPHTPGTVRRIGRLPRVPRTCVRQLEVYGHGEDVQAVRARSDHRRLFRHADRCQTVLARSPKDRSTSSKFETAIHGEWTRYPVDYVIGSKWQQAYATRLPDSRLLVFPIQYSRLGSAWVNYWKIVDAPGSPRTEISRFHDVPPDAVYQNTCAPCHTSQLSFPNGATKPADATFREAGINCEMCHGASLDHVEHVKRRNNEATRYGYADQVFTAFGRTIRCSLRAMSRAVGRARRAARRRRQLLCQLAHRSGRIRWSCRQVSHARRSIGMAGTARRRSSARPLRGRRAFRKAVRHADPATIRIRPMRGQTRIR